MTSQRIDPERRSQEYVEEYVESLIDAYFEIQEVWLIGSRGNATARTDSD